MTRRAVRVENRLGLHARATARFVQTAGRFDCDVRLAMGEREVNGKSLLDVLTLAAAQGSTLELITDGPDEAEAAEALETLIRNRFEEES